MCWGLGAPTVAGPFPQRLSLFSNATFAPDGEITEFINFPGNPQEYLIVDPALESPLNADFGAIKAGAILTRGVFVTRDNRPVPGGANQAGQSGFRDLPGAAGSVFLPTGFNIGRIFASYNPDAYDGEGAYFLAMDISAPAALDSKTQTQPVAFDVDGDGSRQTQTEINPGAVSEAPRVAADRYTVGMDTTGDGIQDVRVSISERRSSIKTGGVSIDPPGGPQIVNGFVVRRFVLVDDKSGMLPGTPQTQALTFLDSNNDGIIDRNDFGVGSDVELVIRNVGLLPNNTTPACVEFFFTADSFDDEMLGGGAEELVRLPVVFPVPDIEAAKKVRCVGDPEAPFESQVGAAAGSQVEFELTIQNRGNVDLEVMIEDVLGCTGLATLTPAAASCTVVTAPAGFDAAGFCAAFHAALGNPQNFPLDIGTLRAADECALEVGEQLVFRFRATVGPSAAEPSLCDNDIDCRNGISVSASTSAPIDGILPPFVPSLDSPNGNAEEEDCDTLLCCAGIPGCVPNDGIGDVGDEFTAVVSDEAGAIDTARERATKDDDNEATVEVECRGMTLTKEVRLLPDGGFVSGSALQLPAAPVEIEYRFTVTNQGELAEDVTLGEGAFCDDLASLQAAFPGQVVLLSCPLCEPPTAGELTATVPAGGPPFQPRCSIRFTTEAALQAFTRADDNRPGCRASMPGGGTDESCYRNCAVATASQPAGICPGPEVRSESFATVCHEVCEISVIKQARCLDNCTQRNPVGEPQDVLPALPGSCLEFVVNATNGSADVVLCRLRINDVLSNQPNDIVFDGGVRFRVGATECPVPVDCVDATGISCDWDPASCGLPGLAPGQTLTIAFRARVPANADHTVSPVNNISIAGAALCPPAEEPAFTCTTNADAMVDILQAQLTCMNKQWEVQSDTDADCEPDGPFEPGGGEVDLSEKLFPVRLRLRIRANNPGDVPFNGTATDTIVSTCVASTPGVGFSMPPTCELGLSKIIPPGGMAEWTCEILVDSADAMRALEACDGAQDSTFRNAARVTGTVAPGTMPFCVSGPVMVECPGTLTTPLLSPPECETTVAKEVKCQDDPDSNYSSDLDVLPGSRQTFRIRIVNTSDEVKIPQVCLTESLGCANWLVAGSIMATIGADNVTACLQPEFGAALLSGARRCYTLECRAAAPWIAPGETLAITFDVVVPANFAKMGIDPDCLNDVDVDAYDNACEEEPAPDGACSTGTGSARFNVVTPAIDCNKAVCVDFNNDGQCDGPLSADVTILADVEFPFSIVYRLTATNQGETSLAGVQLCDEQLVADAVAAGAAMPGCQLNAGCSDPAPLAPGASSVRTCRVQIPNRASWLAFAGRDADGDEDCYSNLSTAVGTVDTGALCDGAGSIVIRSPECSARVCLPPPLPGACCRFDGVCTIATEDECTAVGSTYLGDGVPCLGDNDGNGIDDACEEPIPTISEWGAVIMLLVLLIAAKLIFGPPASRPTTTEH